MHTRPRLLMRWRMCSACVRAAPCPAATAKLARQLASCRITHQCASASPPTDSTMSERRSPQTSPCPSGADSACATCRLPVIPPPITASSSRASHGAEDRVGTDCKWMRPGGARTRSPTQSLSPKHATRSVDEAPFRPSWLPQWGADWPQGMGLAEPVGWPTAETHVVAAGHGAAVEQQPVQRLQRTWWRLQHVRWPQPVGASPQDWGGPTCRADPPAGTTQAKPPRRARLSRGGIKVHGHRRPGRVHGVASSQGIAATPATKGVERMGCAQPHMCGGRRGHAPEPDTFRFACAGSRTWMVSGLAEP